MIVRRAMTASTITTSGCRPVCNGRSPRPSCSRPSSGYVFERFYYEGGSSYADRFNNRLDIGEGHSCSCNCRVGFDVPPGFLAFVQLAAAEIQQVSEQRVDG